jgi:hypothetical protein
MQATHATHRNQRKTPLTSRCASHQVSCSPDPCSDPWAEDKAPSSSELVSKSNASRASKHPDSCTHTSGGLLQRACKAPGQVVGLVPDFKAVRTVTGCTKVQSSASGIMVACPMLPVAYLHTRSPSNGMCCLVCVWISIKLCLHTVHM